MDTALQNGVKTQTISDFDAAATRKLSKSTEVFLISTSLNNNISFVHEDVQRHVRPSQTVSV